MALADTANLIVSLNVRGNADRVLGGINRQIDNLSRNATVRGGLGQISQGIGIGLRNSALIGAAGLGIIATQVRAGVDSLRELQDVEAQTRAGIESTGGAAGQTAEDIRRLAEKYEDIGGVLDDKVIQAGENVLLTFTKIREDAFEPALEAALDMSTRLDQDLNTSILQLGKALNDPVRGLTALRRAGVQFTEEQEDQIKRYVELGDIASAQQVILAEVNEEFGGSFEEAGKTSEATIGRFRDSVEGLQQNLSRAFIPAIDKVARRLNEIFADPKVLAAVEDFGERLAGFLTTENLDAAEDAVRGVFGYLAEIPWGTIGDGLRIAGDAARVAVDAFKSLPPGAQNALITLLAANKLTGGLVATGLGQLASVALGSLKTITAGNVTVIGANVTGGGGVPGGGGFGGQVLKGAKVGAALSAVPLLGVAAVEVDNFQNMRNEATGFLEDKLDNLDRNNLDATQRSIDKIQAQIDMERPFLEGVLFNTNVRPILEDELAELTATKLQLQANAMEALQSDAVMISTAKRQADEQREQKRVAMEALSADRVMLETARTQTGQNATANALLGGINAKDFSPNVYVQTRFNLSSSVIVNGMTQAATVSGTSSAASSFTPI